MQRLCRRLYSTASSRDPLLDAVRQRLFEASVPKIQQHGITIKAVASVAPTFNLPTSVTGLFPSGDSDVIALFLDHLKNKMVAVHESTEETPDLHGVISTRLQLMYPHIKHWPTALATDPILCAKKLMDLVDTMAGLALVPTNSVAWYARRAGIAGVFASTELFMTQDKSPNRTETLEFLKRRLAELESAQQAGADLSTRLDFASHAIKGYLHANGWMQRPR